MQSDLLERDPVGGCNPLALDLNGPALAVPNAESPATELVASTLALTQADTLLGLGCGAGAVSRHLFPLVGGFVGVDRSRGLIERAQAAWGSPGFTFTAASIAGFVATMPTPWRFTAAFCSGSFAHLSDGDMLAVLQGLSVRFTRIRRVLIAILITPDLPKSYRNLGVWHSPAALASLAEASGWQLGAPAKRTPAPEGGHRLSALLQRTRPD